MIYSQYPISFISDNYISGLTISNTMFSVLDIPDYQIYSALFMDNMILQSLMLMDGSYIINNSKIFDGEGLPFYSDDTFGGAINALSPIYLELNNCSFVNNTADFGGAIYMLGGYLVVDNCSFIQNTAKNYGGAIAAENETVVSITNSRFEDNTALNDAAGAIYIRDSELIVENTDFIESVAVFGGAVTSLNSTLKVSKSRFKRNNALFYGGAVMVMYGDVELSDNEFINNSALCGGAVFIDNTQGSIQSEFINNTALTGSAIYSFSNDVSFDNVYEKNELFETDKLNLTIYDAGEYPIFKYSPSNYSVIPDKYNLADYGWVSSVKNQLTEGNCWALQLLQFWSHVF